MKIVLSILLVLSLVFQSLACGCTIYPVESYAKSVDYIFTGKVVELLEKIDPKEFIDTPENREYYRNRSHRARVIVIEQLKIGNQIQDTLEFTSDFTNCDPLYKMDESYLFFAEKVKSKKFKMVHCTPWGRMSDSKEKIIKLRKKLKNN